MGGLPEVKLDNENTEINVKYIPVKFIDPKLIPSGGICCGSILSLV